MAERTPEQIGIRDQGRDERVGPFTPNSPRSLTSFFISRRKTMALAPEQNGARYGRIKRNRRRATALALAEAGAHVLAHYGRSANEAESLVGRDPGEGRSRPTPSRPDLGAPGRRSASRRTSALDRRRSVGCARIPTQASANRRSSLTTRLRDFDNLYATNVPRAPFLPRTAVASHSR